MKTDTPIGSWITRLRRLLRLYWETPIGCEIHAVRMSGMRPKRCPD